MYKLDTVYVTSGLARRGYRANTARLTSRASRAYSWWHINTQIKQRNCSAFSIDKRW